MAAACLLAAGPISEPAHTTRIVPPADTVLTQAERAYFASFMYASVRLYFAHLQDLGPFNLDSAYRAFLDRAIATNDRRSFDLAALEFFASLHNGHTWFDDRWLWDAQGQSVGISARTVESRWLVTASAVPGVAVGDEITAIDGESFEAFFQRSTRYLHWSTDQARRRGFTSRAYLFPRQFTLALAGRPSVRITRGAAELPHPAPAAAWLTANRIGYIRIPSFENPADEDSALAQVVRFRSSEALVIDVRGNGGGITPERLLRAVMHRAYRTPKESTPERIGLFDFYQEHGLENFRELTDPQMLWGPVTIAPDSGAYPGRVLILVDAGCFSACEDFVMPFKDNRRALLIGSQTGGSTGQPYLHDFGNGMRFAVGTKRVFFPDGSRFEGVGIRPDREVPLTQADLRHGVDRALEVARRLAAASQEEWDNAYAQP